MYSKPRVCAPGLELSAPSCCVMALLWPRAWTTRSVRQPRRLTTIQPTLFAVKRRRGEPRIPNGRPRAVGHAHCGLWIAGLHVAAQPGCRALCRWLYILPTRYIGLRGFRRNHSAFFVLFLRLDREHIYLVRIIRAQLRT